MLTLPLCFTSKSKKSHTNLMGWKTGDLKHHFQIRLDEKIE